MLYGWIPVRNVPIAIEAVLLTFEAHCPVTSSSMEFPDQLYAGRGKIESCLITRLRGVMSNYVLG